MWLDNAMVSSMPSLGPGFRKIWYIIDEYTNMFQLTLILLQIFTVIPLMVCLHVVLLCYVVLFDTGRFTYMLGWFNLGVNVTWHIVVQATKGFFHCISSTVQQTSSSCVGYFGVPVQALLPTFTIGWLNGLGLQSRPTYKRTAEPLWCGFIL